MKFDKDLIDPELRDIMPVGRVLPFIFSRNGCKLLNKVLKSTAAGKCTTKDLVYEQRWIKRKDGGKLRICIYRAEETKSNVPGLLWIHGGGYGFGIPETDESFIKDLIQTKQCVVVAPDYRCSIEEPYPAALDDVYASLLWMKHNSEKLGVRSDQLFVGGESAGGGLTAALTLYARDRGTVNIAFQMPLYPMLDDRMITESSKNNCAPVWNTKLNYKGWKLYLGEDFMTSKVSKYAAPSRETDYSNLPPTCTFVGTLEPFRDETITYIENLKAAGVDTYFKIYDKCYHGFDRSCPDAAVSKEATKFLLDTYSYAVEHYFAKQPEAK